MSLTPEGLRPFDRHHELIGVKGATDIALTVETTISPARAPGT